MYIDTCSLSQAHGHTTLHLHWLLVKVLYIFMPWNFPKSHPCHGNSIPKPHQFLLISWKKKQQNPRVWAPAGYPRYLKWVINILRPSDPPFSSTIFAAKIPPGFLSKSCVSGWWFHPLWKIFISQLGWLFPIYGKIKNVPNHQPGLFRWLQVPSNLGSLYPYQPTNSIQFLWYHISLPDPEALPEKPFPSSKILYPPVVKHGNGKSTIYGWFPHWSLHWNMGFPSQPCLITEGYMPHISKHGGFWDENLVQMGWIPWYSGLKPCLFVA